MNSNTFFNRVEILFLNTIISCLSGINRLRVYSQSVPTVSIEVSPTVKTRSLRLKKVSKSKSLSLWWDEIYQVLVPLLIWALLGLAAGFLIGLIKPM
jgi:hypothetical protein